MRNSNDHKMRVQFLASLLKRASSLGIELDYSLNPSLRDLGQLPDDYYDYFCALQSVYDPDVFLLKSHKISQCYHLTRQCDNCIRVFTDWLDDARITSYDDVKYITKFFWALKRSRSYLPDNPLFAYAELLVSLYRLEF